MLWEHYVCLIIDKEWEGEWTATGKDGNDGVAALDQPTAVDTAHTATQRSVNEMVIDFKSFARSYLARDMRNVKRSSVEEFLEYIDGSVGLHSGVSDFIHELTSLEKQYFHLRDKVSFKPFIGSLVNRIHDYIATHGTSIELEFLYAAALSKLNAITNAVHNVTILNVIDFKNTNKRHVIDLRDATHLVNIHETFEDYQESIMDKVHSVNQLIEKEIMPEIEDAFTSANRALNKLIDEAIDLQVKTEHTRPVTEAKKKAIGKLFVMSSMLSGLKAIGVAAMVAGPYGLAIGSGIGFLVKAGNSLATQQTDLHTDVSSVIKVPMLKLNEDLKSKRDLTKFQVDMYKKEQVNSEEPHIIEISKQMDEISVQIDRDIEENSKAPKPSLFRRIKFNMATLNKLVDMAQVLYSPISSIAGQPIVVQLLSSGWQEGSEYLKSYTQNQDKLKIVNQIIDALGQQLQEIETFKDNIYEELFPRLRLFEGDVQSKLNLTEKSHAELDFIKWKNQNWMKKMENEFNNLIGNFTEGDSLMQIIKKLDEVMGVLNDVYGRIETQMRHKQFAQYLAKLQSSSSSGLFDESSTVAIAKLKKIIESNLILEQYELFMFALQQHKFPFAKAFHTNFALSQSLDSINVTDLANNVISKLDELEEKITKSQTVLNDYDRDLKSGVQFGDGFRPAFYTWKYDEIRHILPRLLRGEVITLDANIVKGINETAVKFNEIHLRFTAHRKSVDEELEKSLQEFSNRMTLVGQRFYRCDNRLYVMPNDGNVVIEQSFMINPTTAEPRETNEVYKKLIDPKSGYFLSPYGAWTIQLKSPKQLFDALKQYENHAIDLELVGRGQFFDSSSEFIPKICNEHLDEFYDFYGKVGNEESHRYFKSKFNSFLN